MALLPPAAKKRAAAVKTLPAIVLSLRRTPERTAKARARLALPGLVMTVLDATDGMDEGTAIWLPRDPKTAHLMQPGEVGLCMSWWRACGMIVRNDWPRAIIFEDDAVPVSDARGLAAALSELPENFHFALLHTQQKPLPELHPDGHTRSFVRTKNCSWTTVAVAVSNAGARALLRMLPPFDRPIDVYLRDNPHGLRIFQPRAGMGWFEQDSWSPSTVRDNNRAGTIPRVLHRIWVGSAEIPAEYEAYWEGWRKHHPGWGFRTWGDAEIGEEFGAHPAIRASLKSPEQRRAAAVSDVARLLILEKHGGMYVDTDFECFRNFDPLLASAAVLVPDMHEDVPCNGLLASVPGHWLIHDMVRAATDGADKGLHILDAAGPAMIKKVTAKLRINTWPKLLRAGDQEIATAYSDTGVVVIKPGVLFPYYWTDPKPTSYGSAWAAHHWARSWWGKEEWENHHKQHPHLKP